MDKELDIKKDLTEKPVDELGDLEDQIDDLIYAAERSEAKRQRFALVVDATSSMHGVWDRAKEALKVAVDEIKSRTTVPVQIQIVAYRDHTEDAKEHVVEYSDWSDNTDYLKKYIAGIRCHGGGDYPESIGHGLAHVLLGQQKVNQIILIGDAPSKEGSFGYAEAKLFGGQGCPIYALYTDKQEDLVECFQRLAKLSGGKAFYFGKLEDMSDILKVLLASNKVLEIEYQPLTLEGKRLLEELKK